jgi:predicted Rdx family selenoprotein
MLRAAYFGQELLSTFGTAIGEIALIPATGGLFTVYLTHVPPGSEENAEAQEILLWDRKAEGGFPEVKILKQRLRNHIEPGKDLGHSDKPSKTQTSDTTTKPTDPARDPATTTVEGTKDCEDCK